MTDKNSPKSDNCLFKDSDIICNICYEENKLLSLDCCQNTKKICFQCLGCLKSPLCPWCRQELPDNIFPKSKKPSSCPDSYSEWLNEETSYLLINPYDPELRDSRILRRTMRNIRRNYHRQTNSNSNSVHENRQRRRNERRQLRDLTRRITHEINRGNDGVYDEIFDIDDIF